MDHIQLLEGIKAHPYTTIVAASVVNARITAVFVGAFVAQGYINPFIAYIIFIVMGISGDMLYYFFGRIGHLGGVLLIKNSWQNKLSQLDDKWRKNFPKAILIGKTTAGSKPVIFVAGVAKMPLLKFLSIIVPCTLVLYLLYMSIGYFFGQWIL
ncbi:MAG: VTT domain-containing protein [Patescibacteria group bacterium]